MFVSYHYVCSDPPSSIRMETPETGLHDHEITAQCVTSISVPAAEVAWSEAGVTRSVIHSVQGGYMTVSTITIPPPGPGDQHTLTLECNALYHDTVVTSDSNIITILSKSAQVLMSHV